MTGLFDLESHLVFYRSYHLNKTNVAIHLFCIPLILLTTITFLSVHEVTLNPYINVGSIIALSYGAYYFLLDWKCGIPAFLFLNYFAYYIKAYTLSLSPADAAQIIRYAYYTHIGSWLAQFYGHGVHEKRAPALFDNLLQAIVLAPFFVVFEIAFALGLRKNLKTSMNNRAGVIVRDLKIKELKKLS